MEFSFAVGTGVFTGWVSWVLAQPVHLHEPHRVGNLSPVIYSNGQVEPTHQFRVGSSQFRVKPASIGEVDFQTNFHREIKIYTSLVMKN